MTGFKRHAKGTPPVIDPYIPGNGNFGYRVSRYELDLEYKVNINRLAGTATITAVTLASLKTFSLDLSDSLAVSKVSVNGHRPAQFGRSKNKLNVTLSSALPAGAALAITIRYSGTPRPIRSLWGSVGFRGTHRRRTGRRAAQRGRLLVPVRRPSEQQGQLPDRHRHREPVLRAGQRRIEVAADQGRDDHLDLRATRTDVDLFDDTADRRVRATPAGQVTGADERRPAAQVEGRLRPRFRQAAPDDEALRQAVRARTRCPMATPWW